MREQFQEQAAQSREERFALRSPLLGHPEEPFACHPEPSEGSALKGAQDKLHEESAFATAQGKLPDEGAACEGVCIVHHLGLVPYQAAWDLQRQLVERRKAGEIEDTILFLEHQPVITLGRNARPEHLLTPVETLRQLGIEVVESDRGGDVTFHGPGQLMAYLILDLHLIRKDVVWYVRTLEEALIRTACEFGVAAERKQGFPGVWVNDAKVASLGVHLSRWVTSHGFALNLDTDLRQFRHIVPCGIAGAPVTSFRERLGEPVDRFSVERPLTRHLGELLGLTMNEAPPESAERREQC